MSAETIVQVSVAVVASDPVSRAGIVSQLRSAQGLHVIESETAHVDVGVLFADTVSEITAASIRRLRSNRCRRVMVVVAALDDAGLFAAVEAGASGVLRRAEATPEKLVGAVLSAANGDGMLPPDLLGRLLDQVQHLQKQVLAPRGLTLTGLSARETDVLRLVAEGCDTVEMAKRLCYSERTVKNIIHDITMRLQLRNRAHAVAYAVRHGLI
jgi:DNA-binding NarL/FixJ family response regulator